MAQCISPSFVNGFPYTSHVVLLCGSLEVSSIIPFVDHFHDSIRTVLLVAVLIALLD